MIVASKKQKDLYLWLKENKYNYEEQFAPNTFFDNENALKVFRKIKKAKGLVLFKLKRKDTGYIHLPVNKKNRDRVFLLLLDSHPIEVEFIATNKLQVRWE